MEVEQKFKILKEEILKNRGKIKENKEIISKMSNICESSIFRKFGESEVYRELL